MKRVVFIIMALIALTAPAQESQGIKLQFDQSKVNPQFTMPEMPDAIMPSTAIKPTFSTNFPLVQPLKPDYRLNSQVDSLAIYQHDWRGNSPSALPHFRYDTSPYSRDYSSRGVIMRVGSGYLTGADSHTTYPGMGDMASAHVALTIPVGDRLTVTTGLTGSKYHFDRNAWNDYGVFGNASFRLNDRLSLNAFGQYYINQQFHSVAAMPLLGSSSYGGTLGWKASDNFSLDVGARRIYDPYTGRWRTLPVVQPTINLLGAPISFDAGPLLYQLVDGLFGRGKKGRDWNDWGDPRYRPVTAPNAVTSQPGFNPNSPVPIPDAFRH